MRGPSSESSNNEAGGVFFWGAAAGFVLGWIFGVESGWDRASAWTLETLQQCEETYQEYGFSDIIDCLRSEISIREAEEKAERQAERSDPRT